jgi:hypothetical protein
MGMVLISDEDKAQVRAILRHTQKCRTVVRSRTSSS